MTAVAVTAVNAAEWAPKIVEFASTLDVSERCNQPAVDAGRLAATEPSARAIDLFIANPDALVAVADGVLGTVRGYMICTDDRVKRRRGGGYVRWIGCLANPAPAERAVIFTELLTLGAVRFGWLWGRVAHPGIYDFLLTNITGVAPLDGNPQILTYLRP